MHAIPAEWLTIDLYAELGVPRTASADQLRAAYRDLVPRFHPDRHPGDALAEERFKRIAAAYEVLGDASSRASYDRLRLAGPRPVAVRPPPAHRIPAPRTQVRSTPARRAEPPAPERVRAEAPGRRRGDASMLAGVALLAVVCAALLVVAFVIAVVVVGPDCDVTGDLQRLGCP